MSFRDTTMVWHWCRECKNKHMDMNFDSNCIFCAQFSYFMIIFHYFHQCQLPCVSDRILNYSHFKFFIQLGVLICCLVIVVFLLHIGQRPIALIRCCVDTRILLDAHTHTRDRYEQGDTNRQLKMAQSHSNCKQQPFLRLTVKRHNFYQLKKMPNTRRPNFIRI